MSGVRAHPTKLLAAAAVLGVVNGIGIAFAPTLIGHSPLLLIGMSPLPRHMWLAVASTELIPFVLVGTARRMIPTLLAYSIARWYGEGGVPLLKTRYPRVAPYIEWLERLFARAGWLMLFADASALFAALAGATRMRPLTFVPIAVVSHAGWMVVNYKIGEALSAWLTPIMQFIDAHKLTATLICVALVLAYAWKRRRSQAELVRTLSAGGPPESAASLPPGDR